MAGGKACPIGGGEPAVPGKANAVRVYYSSQRRCRLGRVTILLPLLPAQQREEMLPVLERGVYVCVCISLVCLRSDSCSLHRHLHISCMFACLAPQEIRGCLPRLNGSAAFRIGRRETWVCVSARTARLLPCHPNIVPFLGRVFFANVSFLGEAADHHNSVAKSSSCSSGQERGHGEKGDVRAAHLL